MKHLQRNAVAMTWMIVLAFRALCHANEHARQLYADLLSSYNKIVRPVQNASDVLTIKMGSSLIRIIDVDEKNQVLTTNLWLEIQWPDSKLQWDPNIYGGMKKLHIPSDQLWTPDIVLYNNAAGNPEITIFNDALVYYDGTVVWKPPTIYKSFCDIDVTWFPYDQQKCDLKFGMWTYTGNFVDMKQLPEENVTKNIMGLDFLRNGMDLSYYYRSAEWDLLNVTSIRHEIEYNSCCGPEKYVDISYKLEIRRKTLFYTVNLTVPCALISFLTTYVFYLPAQSDKKITFSISILVTLTVFFLVLIELIPPTSTVIPLFGKYLTFTMILVTISIIASVAAVNFHHRNGKTHNMPTWMRSVFLTHLPSWLFMQRPRPSPDQESISEQATRRMQIVLDQSSTLPIPPIRYSPRKSNPFVDGGLDQAHQIHAQLVLHVLRNVQIIAQHYKDQQEDEEVSADWSFLAMVIDRFFFICFTVCNAIGTIAIIFQAPTLVDDSTAIVPSLPTRPLGGDTLSQLYTNQP